MDRAIYQQGADSPFMSSVSHHVSLQTHHKYS